MAALPREIADELVAIARSRSTDALRVWTKLGQSDDAALTNETIRANSHAWRSLLVNSKPFMELAYDLAQNYLVLVPLSSRLTERRIIKFSYTEQLNRPQTKRPAELWKDLRQVAARARTESIAVDSTGVGRLAITVVITDRFTADPIQQWYKQIYLLIRHLATGQRKRLPLDITGRSLEQLPVGEHACTISAPAHFVALPARRQRIYIAQGKESDLHP